MFCPPLWANAEQTKRIDTKTTAMALEIRVFFIVRIYVTLALSEG